MGRVLNLQNKTIEQMPENENYNNDNSNTRQPSKADTNQEQSQPQSHQLATIDKQNPSSNSNQFQKVGLDESGINRETDVACCVTIASESPQSTKSSEMRVANGIQKDRELQSCGTNVARLRPPNGQGATTLNSSSTATSTTNATTTSSTAGAKHRLGDKHHKLSVVIPSSQRNSLLTPTLVTASDGSGQQFGSLVYLNSQEVSLFTGLPSCTPTTADGLQLTSNLGQINPFFWNVGTAAAPNHAVPFGQQQTDANNNNSTYSSHVKDSQERISNDQQQQQQSTSIDTTPDGSAPAVDQAKVSEGDGAAKRLRLSIDQQIQQAAGAMMLSPLPFWLSPDALIRLGLSANQNPLAAASASAKQQQGSPVGTSQLDHQAVASLNSSQRAQAVASGTSVAHQEAQDLSSPSQPTSHQAAPLFPTTTSSATHDSASDASTTFTSGYSFNGFNYHQLAKQPSQQQQQQINHQQPLRQHQQPHLRQQVQQISNSNRFALPQAAAAAAAVTATGQQNFVNLYNQQQAGPQQRFLLQNRAAQHTLAPPPSIQLSLAPDIISHEKQQQPQVSIPNYNNNTTNTTNTTPSNGLVCPSQHVAALQSQPFIQVHNPGALMSQQQAQQLANYQHQQQQSQVPNQSQYQLAMPQLQGQNQTFVSHNGELGADHRPVQPMRLSYDPQLRHFYLASTRHHPQQSHLPNGSSHQTSRLGSDHLLQQQSIYTTNAQTQQDPVAPARSHQQTQQAIGTSNLANVITPARHNQLAQASLTSGQQPQSDLEPIIQQQPLVSAEPDQGGPSGCQTSGSSLSRDTLSVDTNGHHSGKQPSAATSSSANSPQSSSCSRSSSATMLASDGCSRGASQTAIGSKGSLPRIAGQQVEWQACFNNQLMNSMSDSGKQKETEASASQQSSVPVVKKKSKGGRKKKQVTHEELMARKNRSKERNRVAAKRCRQKRKQFLDELRHKIDDLQKENSSLKGELNTLKQHHRTCRV